MKVRWILMAIIVFAGAGIALSAAVEGVDGDVTVITSDQLTFDYQQQFALFTGNVVVTDPSMKLTANQLKVIFSDDNQVESIEAEGEVRIAQADKVATAGTAVYEVTSGKISLEDNPRVRRGRDLLQGDTITFWRDENKMICEPQARLVIFPDKGGSREKLFGE